MKRKISVILLVLPVMLLGLLWKAGTLVQASYHETMTGQGEAALDLYHPGSFAYNYDGFNSTLYVENTNAITTNLTLQFSGGPTSSYVVPAYGTLKLSPDQVLGLLEGSLYSIDLSADQPVVSVMNMYDDSSDQLGTYSGIDSSANTQVFGPYSESSSLMLQNVGRSNASVTVEFYGAAGDVVASAGPHRIPVNETLLLHGATIPVPDGYYLAVVSSDQPIVGLLGLTGISPEAQNALAYHGALGMGETSTYLPRVLNSVYEGSGPRSTLLFVANTGTLDVDAVLSFQAADGNLAATHNISLPAFGWQFVDLGTESILLENEIRGLRVDASGPIVINEFTYYDTPPDIYGSGTYWANRVPGEAAYALGLPRVASADPAYTVFSVQNLSEVSASLNIDYYDLDGILVHNQTDALAPGGWARYYPNKITLLGENFEGSVIISSNQPIAALVDEYRVAPAFFDAAIDTMLPASGLNDTPVSVSIYGTGFSAGMSARLSDGSQDIAIEGLRLIDSTLLLGTVPAGISITLGIPSRPFDLILTESDGAEGVLPGAYTVLNSAIIDDLFSLDGTDLWSDSPNILAGEAISLGLTIRRQGGTTDLVDVAADFYLDAPNTAEGGSLIGRGTAPLIHPKGAAGASTIFTPTQAGQYTIYAVIDPDGIIPEYLEDNNIVSRTLTVLPAVGPVEPPVIDSLVINDGAVDTLTRTVTIDVSGSSGGETPDYLLYVEYQYIQSQYDWVLVGLSEWLPYQSVSLDYAWELQPTPGVHYIQVWAADSNGLVSPLPGLSFINYLPSDMHVAPGEIHIYHDALLKDEIMGVQLTSLTGDADLYVWDPMGGFIAPSDDTQPVEQVQFNASMGGIYQVEVEGYTSAYYDLAVTFPTSMKSGSLDIQVPILRGRGRPLSVTLPDEKVGLPATPTGSGLFLPILIR